MNTGKPGAIKFKNTRLKKAFHDYRERMKVEQTEAVQLLSERLGYKNYRALYYVLRGERIPRGKRGIQLALELGKSYEYLFGE
jgi:hypothetical protein